MGMLSQLVGSLFSDPLATSSSSTSLTRLQASSAGGFGSVFGSLNGGYGYNQYDSCLSIDICPDLLLGAIAAAAAGMFYLLYINITKASTGRKKKRSDNVNVIKDLIAIGNLDMSRQA